METKNRVVVEGSKVELQCVAKGQPKPTLLWQFKESMVGHKNGSLFISPVSRHHSGDYTCMAFNTRGAATSLLHLQVTPRQGTPPPHTHTIPPTAPTHTHIHMQFPPLFQSTLVRYGLWWVVPLLSVVPALNGPWLGIVLTRQWRVCLVIHNCVMILC